MRRAQRYGQRWIEEAVAPGCGKMPAARDRGGGSRLHLHDAARVSTRHGVLAEQTFLSHDCQYPIRRQVREAAGLAHGVNVWARVAQLHIVEFTALSQGGDGLRVPTPARR